MRSLGRSLRGAALARRLAAGVVVAGLTAAALTGCSTAASGSGCVASGTASDSVTASGAFGSAPTIEFPTPLHVNSTQVSQLIGGTGDPLTAEQPITADLTIVNATTGKTVAKSTYTGKANAGSLFTIAAVPLKGVRDGFVCARVGERLAMVVPPSQGYPAASRPESVAATDSIIVVADIYKAYLARANGVNQVMGSGLPTVVLAPNGQPGITVPSTAAPKSLTIANLKVGSGAVIHEGDTAIVHYTGVLWSDNSVFDSSWKSGSAVSLPVKSSSVVKGMVAALKNQRVGSQVLAIVPPAYGYGSAGSGSIPGGATLVFVIDILGKA